MLADRNILMILEYVDIHALVKFLTCMYVDTGNTALVFLAIASIISVVQKPRAQQLGPFSPFFRLSSTSL